MYVMGGGGCDVEDHGYGRGAEDQGHERGGADVFKSGE